MPMLRRLILERNRAREVESLGVLGVRAEPGMEKFVEQSAQAFAAPMSILTFLHDGDMWIKARVGLDIECLPRKDGICQHAIDRGDILEICDTWTDPLFVALPVVTGAPYIRYYIGAPIQVANRIDVGMLCVLDVRPRVAASEDQRAVLSALARQASYRLERSRDIKGGAVA